MPQGRPGRACGSGDLTGIEFDNDTLEGGAGSDIFQFADLAQGVDSISDFTSGTDKIQVVAGSFGLTAGQSIALVTGTTMPVASGNLPQFLYNATTGALYFDRDGGDGTAVPVQLLTLTGQKMLAASDIVVVE